MYPLPEYPGRTQEGLLGQLLRKKLEPGVEDWVQEGVAVGRSLDSPPSPDNDSAGFPTSNPSITAQDLTDLWAWSNEAAQEPYMKYMPIFGSNFTLEERETGTENVITGLKRKLETGDEDSEDSDEDAVEEGDAMEVVDIHRKPTGSGIEMEVRQDTEIAGEARRAVPLNEQFRFLMTGGLGK